MSVKTYDWGFAEMEERGDGDYVLLTDYESLQRERDALRDELRVIESRLEARGKDYDELLGEDVGDKNICPRCDKEVKNQEVGKAQIDGEMSHVKCAQDELDEIGFDDNFGC